MLRSRSRFFRRTFELPKEPPFAQREAADHGRRQIHGLAQRATNWAAVRIGIGPRRLTLPKQFKLGENLLAVRGENVASDVRGESGRLNGPPHGRTGRRATTTISSDTVWRASKTEAKGWRESAFDDSTWPAAKIAARFGEGPWGNIDTAATAGAAASLRHPRKAAGHICLAARRHRRAWLAPEFQMPADAIRSRHRPLHRCRRIESTPKELQKSRRLPRITIGSCSLRQKTNRRRGHRFHQTRHNRRIALPNPCSTPRPLPASPGYDSRPLYFVQAPTGFLQSSCVPFFRPVPLAARSLLATLGILPTTRASLRPPCACCMQSIDFGEYLFFAVVIYL